MEQLKGVALAREQQIDRLVREVWSYATIGVEACLSLGFEMLTMTFVPLLSSWRICEGRYRSTSMGRRGRRRSCAARSRDWRGCWVWWRSIVRR